MQPTANAAFDITPVSVTQMNPTQGDTRPTQTGRININAQTVFVENLGDRISNNPISVNGKSTTKGVEKSRRWAVASFIVLTVIGLLTNVAAPLLPEPLKNYLWLTWPLPGVLVIVYAVLPCG